MTVQTYTANRTKSILGSASQCTLVIHIVSIGISQHKDGHLNLDYAHEDAAAFHRLVSWAAGKDLGYTNLLLNAEATLAAIQTALTDPALTQAKKEDVFFFFYSGHGAVSGGANPSVSEYYLVPFDATKSPAASCVPVPYLKKHLAALQCKNTFVFIDSCFSGAVSAAKNVRARNKFMRYPKSKGSTPPSQTIVEALGGTGSVIITACKKDEQSYEHDELKHGVFTHALLKGLTKGRDEQTVSVTQVFDEVVSDVVGFSSTNCPSTQTPTTNTTTEGTVRLPTFTMPEVTEREIQPVPSAAIAQSFTPIIPLVALSDEKTTKLLSDLSSLVTSSVAMPSPITTAAIEQYTAQVIEKLRAKWSQGLAGPSSGTDQVTAVVSDLESNATELFMLFALIARYGTEEQMTRLASMLTQMLGWSAGVSGLTALLEAGDAIVLGCLYIVGVVSLAADRFSMLRSFLSCHVNDARQSNDPRPLYAFPDIHYADALGCNALNIGRHIVQLLQSCEWLQAIVPSIKTKEEDLFAQVNFVACVVAGVAGERIYPVFGRYWAVRLRPFTNRLKFDQTLLSEFALLFNAPGIDAASVRRKIADELKVLMSPAVFGPTWEWSSIMLNDVLRKEELGQGDEAAESD